MAAGHAAWGNFYKSPAALLLPPLWLASAAPSANLLKPIIHKGKNHDNY